MKSLLKGTLILLIGMICLSGYATSTHVPEKKDTIEKMIISPTIVGLEVIAIPTVLVAAHDNDIGSSSKAINTLHKENIANPEKKEVPVNPPPLVQLE